MARQPASGIDHHRFGGAAAARERGSQRDCTCSRAAASVERAGRATDRGAAAAAAGDDTLDHDAIKWNRIMISSLCLSMIFSENRFPLFRIMLLWAGFDIRKKARRGAPFFIALAIV
jgi:hypothetical protein